MMALIRGLLVGVFVFKLPPPLLEQKVITATPLHCTLKHLTHTHTLINACLYVWFCFRHCQHDTSQHAYPTSINTPFSGSIVKAENGGGETEECPAEKKIKYAKCSS